MNRRAFYDSFAGLIPAKVIAIEPWDHGLNVTLKLTATRGAYRRGEEIVTNASRAVPREAVYMKRGMFFIQPYTWDVERPGGCGAARPHLSKGFSERGAQMGRHTGPAPSSVGATWQIERVRIDRGGYDQGGAYWGLGAPLWWATDGANDVYFRARDRATAQAHIRAEFDREARFGQPPDEAAAHELALFAMNSSELYRQRAVPIVKALKRKVADGSYDAALAVKAWRHMADHAAKVYVRQWGGVFSVATREAAARELRDHYEEEVLI